MIKVVDKLWGQEEWLVNNDRYCAKYLTILAGYACSLHYHRVKDETFYVTQGEVFLETILPSVVSPENLGFNVTLKAGQSWRIHPGTPHRFRSNHDREHAIVLEVSTTHDDADVVRLEESKCLTGLINSSTGL